MVWLPAALTPPSELLDLSADARTALAEAADFLADALAAGPLPAADVIRAARALGLSLRTLKRAKRLLAIHTLKPDKESPWLWSVAAPLPAPVSG